MDTYLGTLNVFHMKESILSLIKQTWIEHLPLARHSHRDWECAFQELFWGKDKEL